MLCDGFGTVQQGDGFQSIALLESVGANAGRCGDLLQRIAILEGLHADLGQRGGQIRRNHIPALEECVIRDGGDTFFDDQMQNVIAQVVPGEIGAAGQTRHFTLTGNSQRAGGTVKDPIQIVANSTTGGAAGGADIVLVGVLTGGGDFFRCMLLAYGAGVVTVAGFGAGGAGSGVPLPPGVTIAAGMGAAAVEADHVFIAVADGCVDNGIFPADTRGERGNIVGFAVLGAGGSGGRNGAGNGLGLGDFAAGGGAFRGGGTFFVVGGELIAGRAEGVIAAGGDPGDPAAVAKFGAGIPGSVACRIIGGGSHIIEYIVLVITEFRGIAQEGDFFQTGGIKGIVLDHGDAGGDGDALQTGAAQEGGHGNGSKIAGNVNGGQLGAFIEDSVAHLGQGGGKADGLQISAFVESVCTQEGDTFRNGDAGQIIAVIKSAHADAGNTFGNGDASQAAITEAGTRDGGYTLGDDHVVQFIAAEEGADLGCVGGQGDTFQTGTVIEIAHCPRRNGYRGQISAVTKTERGNTGRNVVGTGEGRGHIDQLGLILVKQDTVLVAGIAGVGRVHPDGGHAVALGLGAYVGKACGDIDLLQSGKAAKYKVFNGGDGVGDGKAGDLAETAECVVADLGHTLLDNDGCDLVGIFTPGMLALAEAGIGVAHITVAGDGQRSGGGIKGPVDITANGAAGTCCSGNFRGDRGQNDDHQQCQDEHQNTRCVAFHFHSPPVGFCFIIS